MSDLMPHNYNRNTANIKSISVVLKPTRQHAP